ncbi:MAG: universal stress protein [Polaromonas sp.]
MFKHLLLPTDGSALSRAAIQQGVALAKVLGARVTGVHVSPEFHAITFSTEMLEDTEDQFQEDSERHAADFLAQVEREAQASSVTCETVAVVSDHPYEAIIRTAEERGCDLIAMASHGRKGVKGFLLGSETQKVLVHTDKPVLVFR